MAQHVHTTTLNSSPSRNRDNGITHNDSINFGEFQLFPTERRMEKNGIPLKIGGRALDILIILVASAPEIVDKRDLMTKVWPNITIDDGSLRFHMNGLRKIFGDSGRNGRYIVNVPGRGYCFVAPVSHNTTLNTYASPRWPLPAAHLPSQTPGIYAREDDVHIISASLLSHRFVSIVGSGGVGKTTVAISVAHNLLRTFRGDVHFIDLSGLNDSSAVFGLVASSVGLSLISQDPLSDLVAYLRNRRLILIMDNCEHVIHPAANFAEQCFAETKEVYIITTSREPLRVKGEYVYRLPPLSYPQVGPVIPPSLAMQYPAVRYFVERAIESGFPLRLDNHNADAVGRICRRLGGNPLAIELIAPRVGTFGVEGLARLLDNQFVLNWHGQRTATPRHQTLRSTLDWSYKLLTEQERKVHGCLSIFSGPFQLDAAQAVATDGVIDFDRFIDIVASLAAKSLVIIESDEASTYYRIHDITRTYAIEKLRDTNEFEIFSQNHALFYLKILKGLRSKSINPAIAAAKSLARGYVANVRAALEWAFSENGNAPLAVELAAASGPLFLATSLLVECRSWSERGIAALEPSASANLTELDLHVSLALSHMFTAGNRYPVLNALEQALVLAEKHKSLYQQLQLHACLVIFMIRSGNFSAALDFAHRSARVSNEILDLDATKSSNWLLCIAYHCTGNHALAQIHGKLALHCPTMSDSEVRAQPGYDTRILALTALARSFWISGQEKRAIILAKQIVEEAMATMHPVSLCMSLLCAATICIWEEELQVAEDITRRAMTLANANLLTPYQTITSGLQAQIVLMRGDTHTGVELMQTWFATLPIHQHRTLATELTSSFAEGLAQLGKVSDGIALIDCEIARVGVLENSYAGPELLRMKGELLAKLPGEERESAEDWMKRAIFCARLQSANAWEQRAAKSLSSFYREKGMLEEAEATLMSVNKQTDVSSSSADFTAAAHALNDLSRVLDDTPNGFTPAAG
jgi:predicted ATPase/DNA-binding winged helix-turn-helix (wHTH) protein